jgi:hypothetical protein
MGRRRREGNYTPQKHTSIEDLLGIEENDYPVPDPNKTMINVNNEPSDAHKNNPSNRKSWKSSLRRNTWRSYKKWLTKNYKMHSRNFKTPQIKNMRRHRNN